MPDLLRTLRTTVAAALLLAPAPGPAAPLGAAPLSASSLAASSFSASRLAGRPVAGPIERSSMPPIGEGLSGACGTRFGAVADALVSRIERAECAPLPTPHSSDTDGIAVLEDDGTLFYFDSGGHNTLDVVAACQAFYRTHGDDYDFIAFYLSSGMNSWLGSPGALAAAYPLRNDTQGIGLDPFDYGAMAGSAARLQVPLSMNGLHRYPADPDAQFSPTDVFSAVKVLAHEIGHRWLAYVYVDSAGTPAPALLGRDYQHWNFFADVDSSIMEGCDWASPTPDSFVTDGVIAGYGVLDQYLMGLRASGEVDSFFVVNDPTAFDPPGIYVPYSIPNVGISCRGRATWWRLADIEAVHGPRVPDAATSPHTFRMAVALITPRGSDATPADLAKLGLLRARIASYFSWATQGRGTLDVSLDSRAGQVAIVHEPLTDTEDGIMSRPIAARATIEGGGLTVAVDPASVRAYWRPGSMGPFAPLPLASAGPDSFASALPPQPSGTHVEYYLHASSDSSGIEGFDPPGGPAAPHAYEVGTDTLPPLVIHVPITRERPERVPRQLLARVTDNLGVDSVWVEKTVNGGPLETSPATAAGRDTFVAMIGYYLAPIGTRFAYRFVARDDAAAPNLGYSNAAFDTLVVGYDSIEEFENGVAEWNHAYSGAGSYRDSWHLTRESSSPPGGTAWKFGACGPIAYPPHLDGVLTSRFFSVVPGTLLRFDHRYEFEEASATRAWDGARVEVLPDGGAWQVATPLAGYTHTVLHSSSPLGKNTPCWSGAAPAWRSEIVDLSPWAPGTISVRFRAAADDFIGFEGWFVDHVELNYPGGAVAAVEPAPARLAIGAPWPNPARGRLMQSLALPTAARGEWSLHDLAGRRIATLWKGTAPAGAKTLEARLPQLASGVYFLRLELDGRVATRSRVAILR